MSLRYLAEEDRMCLSKYCRINIFPWPWLVSLAAVPCGKPERLRGRLDRDWISLVFVLFSFFSFVAVVGCWCCCCYFLFIICSAMYNLLLTRSVPLFCRGLGMVLQNTSLILINGFPLSSWAPTPPPHPPPREGGRLRTSSVYAFLSVVFSNFKL